MIERDFTFWMPAEFPDLEKSRGKDIPARVPIEGIAATEDFDDVGEQILVKGCDITWLQNRGIFNYEHLAKKDPDAILGEVESAWKDPETDPTKIMVKGFLWGKDKLVQSILAKAEAMREANSNRRWGLSIEGKIFAREGNYKIVKSMAHSVAVSMQAINRGAFITKLGSDMQKSLQAGFCKSLNEEVCDIAGCCDGSHSCDQSCGDPGCHCKLDKTLIAGHGTSPATQTGGGALRPESLEGVPPGFVCTECRKKAPHGLHVLEPVLADLNEDVNKSLSRDEAIDFIRKAKPGWGDKLVSRFVDLALIRQRAE